MRSRLSGPVLSFASFLVKNANWDIMFVICDIPNYYTYSKQSINTLTTGTVNIQDIPVPEKENRELFSIHAMKHLIQIGQEELFQRFCCYCGLPLCFKNHFDIKFLELLEKEGIWQFVSPSLGFSEVFKTNQHYNSEMTSEVTFMVDLKFNCVIVHNKTTNYVSRNKFFPQDLMDIFKEKHAPKNALPLSTCCIKSLLDHNYPLTELNNVFPSFVVQQWDIVKHYKAMEKFRTKEFSQNQLRRKNFEHNNPSVPMMV